MNAASRPASEPARGEFAALLSSARVIPVLTIERREDAVPLAKALVAGGVRVLEVTLRTPVAIEAAKAILAEVPDAVVGIGTILNPRDLERAQALGAKFGISPGGTPDLMKAAAASGLPFAPGITTSSELMLALAHGFDLVKFFPGRAVRRHQGAAGAGRPVSRYAILPDRGHRRSQCGTMARRAERDRGRRLLAMPGVRRQHGQLERHHRYLQPSHEFAETGVKYPVR